MQEKSANQKNLDVIVATGFSRKRRNGKPDREVYNDVIAQIQKAGIYTIEDLLQTMEFVRESHKDYELEPEALERAEKMMQEFIDLFNLVTNESKCSQTPL